MAFKLDRLPMWKGKYPMSDTAHADDLDMRSTIYQHMQRLPEHEAQARAHTDYRKEQIEKAAGHHWNGMKASFAAGNDEAAKKHGVMYTLALHQLGHKDTLNPPKEVLEAAKDPKQAIGTFRAHPGDAYSMPPVEPSEPQQRNQLEPHVKGAAVKTAPLAKAQDGAAPGSEEVAPTEDVPSSPKCTSCKGPFHPDTGHQPMEGVQICGPCTHRLVAWLVDHTRRPYGSKETPFYEAAKTSIKPGAGSDDGLGDK
jgi:hypothetical protein